MASLWLNKADKLHLLSSGSILSENQVLICLEIAVMPHGDQLVLWKCLGSGHDQSTDILEVAILKINLRK